MGAAAAADAELGPDAVGGSEPVTSEDSIGLYSSVNIGDGGRVRSKS